MVGVQHLQRPWGRLAYSDTGGAGAPLLLLHGTGCDSDDWSPMVRAMRGGSRVVRVDFRGHGASDVSVGPLTLEDLACDVCELVRHLSLRRFVLAGHSLGGMVATLVAEPVPGVAGLVLLESWTNRAACDAFPETHTLGHLNAAAREAIAKKDAAYLGRFRRDDLECLVKSGAVFDATRFLRHATIPILEIWGGFGRTETTLDKLNIPANPRIEVAWIPDAGHYLPHERPEACADFCSRMIRQIGAKSYSCDHGLKSATKPACSK